MQTNYQRRVASFLLKVINQGRALSLARAAYRILPIALRARMRTRLAGAASGAQRFSITPSRERETAYSPRRPAISDGASGVNLYGYVGGEFGLAEALRMCTFALEDQRYPFTLLNFALATPGRSEDSRMSDWQDVEPVYPVSVYFVNPDRMLMAPDQVLSDKRSGRYVIGYWFWELESIPDAWLPAMELVDEVWVASEFIQNALVRVTNKPVRRIPLAVKVPSVHADRSRFGFDESQFVFLFSFDFHSYPERKNPSAVVSAFKNAFPSMRSDVLLVIKTINGDKLTEAYEKLVLEAASDERIVVQDVHLSQADMSLLMASVDAYVSLHRSEGLGLSMLEAMAMGKPVIATAYSGNLEFMLPGNSCLVGYERVAVSAGSYPFGQGQSWAAPDISQAACFMRKLADEPEYARRVGEAARVSIREKFDLAVCAKAVAERIAEVCSVA